MRAATIMLLVLAILPLATAIETGSVKFEVAGEELEFVRLGAILNGNLVFTPDPEADLVQIVSPNIQGGQATLALRGCTECRANVNIVAENQVQLRFGESIGNEIRESTATLQFRVDNVAPRISDIKMGSCSSACVYSDKQKTISFTLADAESGIDNRTISVKPTSIGFDFANNCQAAQRRYLCSINVTGRSDQEVKIEVTDRAGNPATGTMAVRYDGTPPAIVSEPELVGLQGQVAGGMPATVRVVVEEPEGANILIQLPFANETGRCERINQRNNNYECTVLFTPPNERRTLTAKIIVSDLAGNTQERRLPINIYPSENTVEPNFWNVEATPLTRLDSQTWLIHEKQYPLQLELRGSPGAVPVQVQVQQCGLRGLARTGTGGVSWDEPQVPTARGGKYYTQLSLKLAPAANPSAIEGENLTCNVRILTRIGGTIFTNPEEEVITVEPMVLRLPSPGQALKEQEEALSAEIDDRQRSLALQQQILNTMQIACGIPKTLSMAGQVMNTGAAGAMVAPFGQAAAEGLERGGHQAGSAAGRIHSRIGPFCDLLSCQQIDKTPYGRMVDDLPLLGGDGLLADAAYVVGDVPTPAQLIDPYKSEYVAIATVCYPAYLYHQQAKLALECELKDCISTADQTGLTIEECRASREFNGCMLTTGSLYNLMPYTNIWEGMVDMSQQAVRDPLSIVGLGASVACGQGNYTRFLQDSGYREALPLPVRIGCNLVQFGEDLEAFTGLYQTIKQEVTLAQSLYSTNYCEQATQALATARADRPPFTWGQTCSVGYCTYLIGDREIVVTGNKDNPDVYLVVQNDEGRVHTDGGLAAQEEFYGGRLQKVNCGLNRDLCREGKQAYSQYASRMQHDVNEIMARLDTSGYVASWQAREGTTSKFYSDREEATKEAAAAANDLRGKLPSGIAPGSENEKRYKEFIRNSVLECGTCTDAEVSVDFIAMGVAEGVGEPGNLLAYYNLNVRDDVDKVLQAKRKQRDAEEVLRLAEEGGTSTGVTQEACAELGGTYSGETCSDVEADEVVADRAGDAIGDSRTAALLGEYETTAGSLRRHLKASRTYGQIGTFVAGAVEGFGTDLGWYKDVQEFFTGVSDKIGMASGEEAFTRLVCEDKLEKPEPETIYSETGKALARISAQSAENEGTYQYRIETFARLPSGSDEFIKLELRDPGSRQVANFTGQVPARAGRNSITIPPDTIHYRTACLVFEQDIERIFGEVRGADGNAICTRIVEVNE